MNTVGGGLEKKAMGEQNEQRISTCTVHWSSFKKYFKKTGTDGGAHKM